MMLQVHEIKLYAEVCLNAGKPPVKKVGFQTMDDSIPDTENQRM